MNNNITVSMLSVFLVSVSILTIIGWHIIVGSIHYSAGTRVGEIVKFSQRGFFIKNWCGEMSVGGQGQAGYLFDFGIDRNANNASLVQKLEVTYDQRGANNPFNGCSDYLVTNVKVIK